MANHLLNGVVGRMSAMLAASDAADRSDAELVRGYIGHRDRAAFEAIVRRHGPMVLGVCRRLLRNAADADDAFQATFIVLLRKAQSLRRPERLAGWLYQVAYRVARKARLRVQLRGGQQLPLTDPSVEDPVPRIMWNELRPIFDDELSRLPDKLRLPVLLCFLEGLSKREAARRLAWPEGTVSSRLQLAREKLRLRLSARGLALSTGAFHLALFHSTAPAAIPPLLLNATLQNITQATVASASAVALAEGMVQAMFLTKLKLVAVVVLAVGLFGGGTGWVFSDRGATNAAYAQSGPSATPSIPTTPVKKTTASALLLQEILKANDPTVSDAEFVRRVYLDLHGRLPTANEVRQYSSSNDADKRTKLVDLLSKEMPFDLLAKQFLGMQDPGVANRIAAYEKAYRAQVQASSFLDWMRVAQPDDRTLVRRLWLDFLGLPPNSSELDEVRRLESRIAEFEKRMYEAEINQKRAEVEAAQAALKDLEALIEKRKARLLERQKEYYLQAIAQAHAEFERQLQADRQKQLETEIEQWRDRVAWIDRMVLKGYATRTQADADKSRLAALQNELRDLIRQTEVRRIQNLVRDREMALQKEEDSLSKGTGSEASRDRVLASLAEAKIELARNRIREELTTLVALRQRELDRIEKAVEQKLLPGADLEKARKALDEAKKRLADAEK